MISKHWYGLIIFVSGLYIHEQYGGNGNNIKEKREDGEKGATVIKCQSKRRGCFWCRRYDDQEKNILWQPCQKVHWLHDQCKRGTPYQLTYWAISHFFNRNISGLIPLSMAIFRGRKEIERQNSRQIVDRIMQIAGKHAYNMLMLRDHAGCSAWMHAIYLGDPVVIQTIISQVALNDDAEAIWKLLTTNYSGAYKQCTLTPLMVAVRQKNIPVIRLLKDAAGSRFGEYLMIKGETGKQTCRGEKIVIDFAGNDAEILQLLSVEESDESESDEYIVFDIV